MATNFSKKDMIKLQNLLRKSKKTITTAESCTGGLVASMITKISGSSDIFNGSIVTYSNTIKNQELGVLNESLDKFGAVSKKVVSEMLDGVLKKFEADFASALSTELFPQFHYLAFSRLSMSVGKDGFEPPKA